ncbi:MAG: hypothetical protein K2X07_13715 [Caulobacteraceae bacterium]|nr:hypothetical protein [Caulobacteraceae bacterium]
MSTTIYFELASSTLPRLGIDTLDALGRSVEGGAVVEIVGHSDAAEAGSGLTNLDVQRAAAVAAGFAADPARSGWSYRLSGADASRPAQATPTRVSEPLNRRADISICRN